MSYRVQTASHGKALDGIKEDTAAVKHDTTAIKEGTTSIKEDTTALIESHASAEEEATRRSILDWVEKRVIRFDKIQGDHFNRAQAGTGTWFLESEPFQSWCTGTAKTMYCPGIPGAGKTIIASVVANYLSVRFPQADTNVSVIYFNYKSQGQQGLTRILLSILWQFVYKRKRLDKRIQDFWKAHERSEPSADAISALLGNLVQNASRSFIVLDALDEISNEGGMDSRKSLLNSIMELQKTAATGHALHVLMTARPDTELPASFNPESTFHIYSAEQDLRLFLKTRVNDLDCLPEDDYDDDMSQSLKERIVDRILEAADGM
ncbi:uncharacterized protein B0I36DRAFT_250575 [Microdochium trichocladiopsis]|uniref:Nephrocystin 3-like N-terminal domain-containing protein n=1 Tax=Microdochium trichocladiopsis TaxID=1682393 RepID=A0A9P8Y1G8_9PEZI|nr:uncharacterized protein B0I36DRAFT_250575 [Microdochium trichocladiopsis]KAH7025086.1 hypothetical protein B0I36DRAFT_250575 [Microdochium trichocladiopsis]